MFLSLAELGSVVLDINGTRLDSTFIDSTGQPLDSFTISKGSSAFPPLANFDVSPNVGAAPLSVDFTDLSANAPTAWSWDFDDDGTPDSSQQSPTHQFQQPGRYSVRLAVTNSQGSDELLRIDEICVHGGVPGPIDGLTIQPDRATIRWNPLPASGSYDVVRGDLLDLRSTGGDFGSAQRLCVVDDVEVAEANGRRGSRHG